ncbi:uncharacterized protein CTRU02_204985 [Colletotrichum truncatum]|uniref:Uncharacterized protein n=1 Tax=Colletotrichum truncatum TaxID=5467 RepID=A0ACC3Z2R0_COLTU|nr:uncharacterized protein CTRU02_06186 [Colletotrichum truncatum]KAF6793314.1 hypothetical protein CTRU02_06186 [Colletotrichum truncatum]
MFTSQAQILRSNHLTPSNFFSQVTTHNSGTPNSAVHSRFTPNDLPFPMCFLQQQENTRKKTKSSIYPPASPPTAKRS